MECGEPYDNIYTLLVLKISLLPDCVLLCVCVCERERERERERELMARK